MLNLRKLVFTILMPYFMTVMALANMDTTKVEQQDRETARVLLTAQDFKKLNCENVGDALRNITGVYINTEGEVSLRDVSASKVVIILDGQRLNSPGTVSVNVTALSIENIEQIELLRGGRSAQYGADAVGGVILITSRQKQSESKVFDFGVRTSYGSYNRQIYSVNHSMTREKINYMISYRRDLWDGDYEYSTPSPYDPFKQRVKMTNNDQSSHNVFFKTGLNLAGNQQLQGSFSYYKSETGAYGMTDNLTPKARLRYDNKSYNMNYDKDSLFYDFDLKALTYFQDYETKFDNPEGLVPIHSDHDNYALGLELQQAGKLSKLISLSYGYSYRNDKIHSTDIKNRIRDTHSAFTTLILANAMKTILSRWEVDLALRYDAPSDFNSEFSPRVSVTLSSEGKLNTSLVSHFTRSYRAPTFNDLYWPRDAFAVGNPDLKPEYGLNYDIGINAAMPVEFINISTAVNYFNNDVTDLILWAQDPSVGNLWTPNNISKTSTWGIETSVTLDLFKGMFVLNSEYTYMKALDKGPDVNRHNKYIIYRPKNKLDLTATYRLQKIEFNAIYHYVGLRYSNPANTKWLPSYNTVDVNATYRFNLLKYVWHTTLDLTNLIDEDFQKVQSSAEPGRMFKVTVGVDL